MSSSAPPLPQEIAGRYEVESRLGAGAFGTVYKARDKVLGRRVAIKTIRLDGMVATQTALAELVERFQREARVSAQLRHPGIVTIYDVGEADGAHYLAMEFIDGTGLDRLIAGERRLQVGRAAAICAQVAEALSYAHEQGVVHRDIKPANIMIEPGDRVKVADFGIAKVKDAGEQQLTATGSLLGTPSYMSPEQARGLQLDGRSDLFSLGCVLYEMLKGRKAFQGDSITSLLFKIIAEEPPPLRDDDPEIPAAIETIVKRALAKSPADRFASGHEMAAALLAMSAPGSVDTLRSGAAVDVPTRVLPAPPPSPPPAPAPAPVPHDAATSVTAAPTSVTAAATQGRVPPRPAPVPRPAPPSRPTPGVMFVLLGCAALALLTVAATGAWWVLARRAPEPVASTASAADPRPLVAPPTTAPAPAADDSAPYTPPAAAEAAPAPGVPQAPAARPAASAVALRPTPLPARGASPAAAAEAPTTAPAQRTAAGFDHLDDEEQTDPADGGEAGRRLAESFRGGRGDAAAPGGRFVPRARSPQDLRLAERPAVATIRHVIQAQLRYARQHGGYGSLAELKAAGLLRLDVALQGSGFQRRGYRFELRTGDDEFRLRATPLLRGLRAFVGDESGLIRQPEQGAE